jgi:hypothetical protein
MVAAVGLTIVTGCALTSPDIITDPYVAADGANADLPLGDGSSLSLRNVVVVLDKAGGTGQVIGAVSYDGTEPVILEVAAANPAQVPAVTPSKEQAAQTGSDAPALPAVSVGFEGPGMLQIGPEGTPLVLPAVTLAPGQHLDLTARSPSTGAVQLRVPIVAPTHYYEGLTATVGPTAAITDAPATPTESVEPEATASP